MRENCPEGAVFLAAVSGGADSIAMLAALSSVMCKPPVFSLTCLHVEHGLRPAEESQGDAVFVREFCEKLGIECCVKSIPPGKIASFARTRGVGIEAAARFFRRRALFREAGRLGKNVRILVAHTRDDMLETALMRVLRGAGPAGLAAMPENRGRLLRPLLSMSRADVLEYLTKKNIPWREDSTNTDVTFLRNRIRRQLIPLLNESFPAWKSGLAAMAEIQSLATVFIQDEAMRRVEWKGLGIEVSGTSRTGVLAADAETFFSQPEIIREEALFQGIDQCVKINRKKFLQRSGKKYTSWTAPKRSVIRRFCAGSVNAADLGPLRVQKQGKQVVLSAPKNGLSESGFSLLIKEPGLYNLKSIGIEVCSFSAPHQQCDADGFCACLPLVFRRSFKDDFLDSKGKKIALRNLADTLLMRSCLSAADRMGTAAIIGLTASMTRGILYRRDLPLEERGSQLYWVTIKRTKNGIGGTDV